MDSQWVSWILLSFTSNVLPCGSTNIFRMTKTHDQIVKNGQLQQTSWYPVRCHCCVITVAGVRVGEGSVWNRWRSSFKQVYFPFVGVGVCGLVCVKREMFNSHCSSEEIDWKKSVHAHRKVSPERTLLRKILEDTSPFCGTTDTPVLDFWWRLPLDFKARVDPLRAFSPVWSSQILKGL